MGDPYMDHMGPIWVEINLWMTHNVGMAHNANMPTKVICVNIGYFIKISNDQDLIALNTYTTKTYFLHTCNYYNNY